MSQALKRWMMFFIIIIIALTTYCIRLNIRNEDFHFETKPYISSLLGIKV